MRLGELLAEAGLPDGVFNIVHGGRETVEALLAHEDVRAVSFVGSQAVAKAIYHGAAAHGKRVQALAGAKNHLIVLPDADLDFTVEAIVGSAFGSAGQRCMAGSVLVAQEDVADRLLERLVERSERLRIGPGDQPGVEMGPLIREEHRERVKSYIEIGQSEGAELIVDGRKASLPDRGFFLGPTIFTDVDPDMRIAREEIFGPVLSTVRVQSVEEGIALDQPIGVRQRRGFVHPQRCGGPSVSPSRQSRHVGRQHRRARARGRIPFQRLARVILRGSARQRRRRHQLLHRAESGHQPLGVSRDRAAARRIDVELWCQVTTSRARRDTADTGGGKS